MNCFALAVVLPAWIAFAGLLLSPVYQDIMCRQTYSITHTYRCIQNDKQLQQHNTKRKQNWSGPQQGQGLCLFGP